MIRREVVFRGSENAHSLCCDECGALVPFYGPRLLQHAAEVHDEPTNVRLLFISGLEFDCAITWGPRPLRSQLHSLGYHGHRNGRTRKHKRTHVRKGRCR